MARIASTHNLVDILFQRNPDLPEPNTYIRGSTRIDFALISPELTDAVSACGYESYHQRIKSDHRGFFLDFNTEILFGNETPALAPMSLRDFLSKNPANNTAYIQANSSSSFDTWQSSSPHQTETTPKQNDSIKRSVRQANMQATS